MGSSYSAGAIASGTEAASNNPLNTKPLALSRADPGLAARPLSACAGGSPRTCSAGHQPPASAARMPSAP